jgi:hypothetical protein
MTAAVQVHPPERMIGLLDKRSRADRANNAWTKTSKLIASQSKRTSSSVWRRWKCR